METLRGRLQTTGVGLYGVNWRRRLAEGLGISRGTLFNMMCGPGSARSLKRGPQADIDGALIELVERERDACAERSMSLTQLRNKLIAARGK